MKIVHYTVRMTLTWPAGLTDETIQLVKPKAAGLLKGILQAQGDETSAVDTTRYYFGRARNSWIYEYGLELDYFSRVFSRAIDTYCSREGSRVALAVYRETEEFGMETINALRKATTDPVDIPGLELVAVHQP